MQTIIFVVIELILNQVLKAAGFQKVGAVQVKSLTAILLNLIDLTLTLSSWWTSNVKPESRRGLKGAGDFIERIKIPWRSIFSNLAVSKSRLTAQEFNVLGDQVYDAVTQLIHAAARSEAVLFENGELTVDGLDSVQIREVMLGASKELQQTKYQVELRALIMAELLKEYQVATAIQEFVATGLDSGLFSPQLRSDYLSATNYNPLESDGFMSSMNFISSYKMTLMGAFPQPWFAGKRLSLTEDQSESLRTKYGYPKLSATFLFKSEERTGIDKANL